MIKALSFIQKKLTIFIPVFMVGGFLIGLFFDNIAFLKNLILPFTFLMVYPMMVNMQVKKIVEKGGMKVLIAAQIINFAVIPFLAFFMGRIFFADKPFFALGFLLVSLLPTSGMTISWTAMSKGNMESAVKMTVIGLLLGSLLTPLYIKWLMGAEISIPIARVFTQIAVIVFLPLILGVLTRTILVKKTGQQYYNEKLKKKFPPFSTLGVLLIVFIAMALKAKSIIANPVSFLKLIPPLVILYAVNFIISTAAAKLFFNRGDGLALVYGTVLRNLSIALAIAMTSFGKSGSDIALVIALGYIIQIQGSSWYVKLSSRLFREPEAHRGRPKEHVETDPAPMPRET